MSAVAPPVVAGDARDVQGDVEGDPFLALLEDPAFLADLRVVADEWDADAPFLYVGATAPDDPDAPETTDELLARAAVAAPGRRGALLDLVDPAHLDGAQAEEYARLYATVAAHVAYKQLGARLAIDARCRSPKDGGASFAGTSLAVAEKVSPATADVRLTHARTAVERLPDLVALLGAGEISEAHLRTVLEATRTLSLEACHEVQAQVAAIAPDVAPGRLGKAARRAAAAIDPDDFARRQSHARAGRCAYVRPGEDGMAFLGITGPATQIALAHLSLDEPRGRCAPPGIRARSSSCDATSPSNGCRDPATSPRHPVRPTPSRRHAARGGSTAGR